MPIARVVPDHLHGVVEGVLLHGVDGFGHLVLFSDARELLRCDPRALNEGALKEENGHKSSGSFGFA